MRKHLRGPSGHDPDAQLLGPHHRHLRTDDGWRVMESQRYLHWPDTDLSFWYEYRDERVIGEGETLSTAWRDVHRRRAEAA